MKKLLVLISAALCTAELNLESSGLPPGSYWQTCKSYSVNERVERVLSCSCKTRGRSKKSTELKLSSCTSSGISNCDGNLTCGECK